MPSTSRPGPFARAWYRWKSLRLPWRKTWLVGHDLAGNTFWEFKDALNANRLRRIMKHTRQTHYADVQISPQWHQWLRHTRHEAPSVQEQQYDVSRQAMMKQLAAKADERWKSIPSYLDAPNKQQPQPALEVQDPGGYASPTEPDERAGVRSAIQDQETGDTAETQEVGKSVRRVRERERDENPWQRQQRGAPSENWQPESWTPGMAQRR